MNSSFDLLVIVIGVLATVVGVIVLFRMMRSPDEEQESETTASTTIPPQPSTASPRPYLRITPQKNLSGTVTQTFSNKEAYLNTTENPTQLVAVSEHTVEENLSADALTYLEKPNVNQPQSNLLRLTLSVAKDVLIYEKITLGEWNELQVSYEPPIFRKKESYAPGTALNFHISGDKLDTSTYQFSVHYHDHTGRAYRQEIGGMGTEHPIIEGPVAIGNWQ